MKMFLRRVFVLLLSLLVFSGCGVFRSVGEPLKVADLDHMPTPESSPVRMYYEKSDECVRKAVIASGYPIPVIMVGGMPNRTGRVQSDEGGAGYFVTLDGSYMLSGAFEAVGFRRVTRSPEDIQYIDKELVYAEKKLAGDGAVYNMSGKLQENRPIRFGQLRTSTIMVNAVTVSYDMIPGQMFSLGAWGAWVGKRRAAARISVDFKMFNPWSGVEYTTVNVNTQVVVHDYQAGINRYLTKPMMILIGAEFGTTVIGMHDIAMRQIVQLGVYKLVATLYPNVASACNQFTGGFMTDNPGEQYMKRFGEPLILEVMKPLFPLSKPKNTAQVPLPRVNAESAWEKVARFIPCKKGPKGCVFVDTADAQKRIQAVEKLITTGGRITQIIGVSCPKGEPDVNTERRLVRAQFMSTQVTTAGSTVVRSATDDELLGIHAAGSKIRNQAGVLIELEVLTNGSRKTPGSA